LTLDWLYKREEPETAAILERAKGDALRLRHRDLSGWAWVSPGEWVMRCYSCQECAVVRMKASGPVFGGPVLVLWCKPLPTTLVGP